MRKGSYSYKSYLGINYFKERSYHYEKCNDGVYHLAIRCYLPTDNGNYIEFKTLAKCLAYIRVMVEIEKAKLKLEALVV